MPKITESTVKRDSSDDHNDPCGPFEALLFSDTGGLTQFGAFVEILPPGSKSSIKHWHRLEDEMIYVLDGTATLHEGDHQISLTAGEAATFRAGEPVGHCLENTSDAPVKYLVIGTRSAGDVVTYPDKNRRMDLRRTVTERIWTDQTGAPAEPAFKHD